MCNNQASKTIRQQRKNKLKNKSDAYHTIKIIAVSKNFGIENIKPLIEYGHIDFGENKIVMDLIKKELVQVRMQSLEIVN